MRPRSFSAGKRKTATEPSSVVRVYSRPDVPGRFFMTRAWILAPSGRPAEEPFPAGTTWEYAKVVCRAAADERRAAILGGRRADGTAGPLTIGALLDQYEAAAKEADWSDGHRAEVGRSLAFWRRHLGAGADVATLTPAVVERIAAREGKGQSPRWAQKRLKHLRAVTRWGRRKARLYAADPLDGVELPEYEPDTDALIYSPEETVRLMASRPDVDWRVTLLANIAADTGRRLGAMLSLRVEDVSTDGQRVLLRFRREFDKQGRAALVPVSAPTAELIARALEEDVVSEWGWLFPEGRLDYDDARDKPWGNYAAIWALHEAEQTVGVPTVPKRGYHGLKRRHVTSSMEVAHGDTALVGDLTGNVSAELIRRVYRKGNRARTAAHVDAVRASMEGQKAPESARESTRSGEAE